MPLRTKVFRKIKQILSATHCVQQNFGFKLAFQGFIRNVPHVSDASYYSQLRQCLYEKYFSKVVFEASEVEALPTKNDGPIWIMWWQGLNDETDPLIKACIESIIRHKSNRRVIILTKDNYQTYVTLPPKVQSLLNAEKITLTHFSDYLRFYLLYNYGGVWLDASIYLSKDIDSTLADYDFYSISRTRTPSSSAFSKHWSAFFLAGTKGNPLFKYWLDCFSAYWSTATGLVDYFLVDLIIYIGYTHEPKIKEMIDKVPLNNPNFYYLYGMLNSDTNALKPTEMTYVHKLTYKSSFRLVTKTGNNTAYKDLINQNNPLLEKKLSPNIIE